jgi:ABC-type sugar transport system ATPase subunit
VASGSAIQASAHKLLEAIEISKRFPGVQALDGVNFDLAHGETMCCSAKTVPASRP